MKTQEFFGELIGSLPDIHSQHAPHSKVHVFLKQVARERVESAFGSDEQAVIPFGPFGDLRLPYLKMGAVDTMSLFDLDELIMFSFYWLNRKRYRRALDIGANIGLHSLVLDRCGLEVRCFEPDPFHFGHLKRNVEANRCAKVTLNNAAVSNRNGQTEFIRVLGNTMSSHIAGSKASPYGELERFTVDVRNVKELIGWADLMKLDAEGHEKEILLAIDPEDWRNLDALVEVGSAENASLIFSHFKGTPVNLFTQKTDWRKAQSLEDVPTSYKEGTLFISCKSAMPWEPAGRAD